MKLKNQKTVYVWKMGRLVLTALVLWLFAGSIFCVKAAAAKPETPVMLSAKAVSASSIKIQWQVKERQTGAYAIYRKDGKGSFRIIDFVKALGTRKTTYLDETVMPGTRYTYAVAVIPKEKLVSPFVWSSSGNSSKKKLYFRKPDGTKVYKYLVFSGKNAIAKASASASNISYKPAETQKDAQLYALVRGGWGARSTKTKSAKTTLPSTKVISAKLVSTGTLKVKWKKSKGATGYVVYRRKKGSSSWKKIATVTGADQIYCYSTGNAANTTYYFTVKAYYKKGSKKVYASYNKTGLKVSLKSTSVPTKTASDASVYGPSLSGSQQAQVWQAVDSFCQNYITSDMSTVEKLMTAQLYMVKNCTYAATWAQNGANTAWGALVYRNSRGIHEAQCSGYARGYKALCDGMGIPCKYVHSSTDSHQWVEVQVNGKWYIIDPTCNTATNFWMFLISGSTYRELWQGTVGSPQDVASVSTADYPEEKIKKAYNGYKVQNAIRKIF